MSAIDPMKDRVARSGFIHPTEPRCELQCHECGCFVSECRCAHKETSNITTTHIDIPTLDIEEGAETHDECYKDSFPRTESVRRYLAGCYTREKQREREFNEFMRQVDRSCFWMGVAMAAVVVSIVLIIKDLL